jgi:proteasome lid subunit RPN8/RPN11
VRIARDIIEKIIAHAERDAPVESCGFLMGQQEEITRHRPITNVERRTDHFTFEPNEQLACYQDAARDELEIIGVYHSHPVMPAMPSAEDIRLARKQNLLYVIISLMEGKNTVRGFYIKDGKVEEEALIVYDDRET